MTEPTAKRRSWIGAIPLLLFVLIAIGWSAGWLYLRGRVATEVDRWFAAEAAKGRPHLCPDRTIGGYPFSFEVACTNPVFVVPTPTGPLLVTMKHAAAVALVYQPRHVILDLIGPVTLSENGKVLGALTFARGQASISASGNELERISIVLDKPQIGRALEQMELAATHFEFHIRPSEAPGAGPRDFDVASSVRGFGQPGMRANQGADLALAAIVRKWPAQLTPGGGGPVADWARGGGSVDLQQLQVSRGSGLASASGSVGFNANGRAQGLVQAVIVDSAQLLGGLNIPGVGDPSLFLGPVLSIVGRPADLDGKRGTRVDIRVENGVLSVGAVQLSAFPPVF